MSSSRGELFAENLITKVISLKITIFMLKKSDFDFHD